jgi:cytochrome c-type biogenesis protein
MGETFAGLVTDGPLLVAAAVAALVGLISFASPCVLPLVPGYLSYVAGLVGTGAPAPTVPSGGASPAGAGGTATAVRTDTRTPRGRMVLGAVLFVLGFSLVFVTFATAFGGLGRLMLEYSVVLDRVFGVVTVLVGLAFLGWLPLLQRTKKLSVRPAAGLAGAPLLGIVFGLGWTPCLGPTLAAVYSLALSEATAARGAVLGVAYCLGLGVPFVLVALGARWALGATGFLRRHARTVTRIGGAVLVVVGLLLLTGAWAELMSWLRSWLAATGFAETSL